MSLKPAPVEDESDDEEVLFTREMILRINKKISAEGLKVSEKRPVNVTLLITV